MIQVTASLETRLKSKNYKCSFVIEMEISRECLNMREDIMLSSINLII